MKRYLYILLLSLLLVSFYLFAAIHSLQLAKLTNDIQDRDTIIHSLENDLDMCTVRWTD